MSVEAGDLLAVGSRAAVYTYGDGAVVKVPFDSTPDPWIAHEARHAGWARNAGAAAPRLLGLETVRGRTASVWEWIRGETLWHAVTEGTLRPDAAGRLLAEVQQELRAVPAPVQLPRQVDRLVAKVRVASTLVAEDLRTTLELAATATGGTLCHGDLHPGNVVLGPDGPVVLDWFDAARGDPEIDVARSWLTVANEGGPRHRHLPRATPDLLAELSAAHARATGMDPDDTTGRFAAWVAVQAAARISERVETEVLLAVWRARHAAVHGQVRARD